MIGPYTTCELCVILYSTHLWPMRLGHWRVRTLVYFVVRPYTLVSIWMAWVIGNQRLSGFGIATLAISGLVVELNLYGKDHSAQSCDTSHVVRVVQSEPVRFEK